MEIRNAQDGEARIAARQIALVSAQKKLTGKEIMPGQFGNHLQGHAIMRIGPGSRVEYKHIASLQVRGQTLAHNREMFTTHRMIVLAPPDLLGVFFVRDNVFIFWRTPGMRSCSCGKCAIRGQ